MHLPEPFTWKLRPRWRWSVALVVLVSCVPLLYLAIQRFIVERELTEFMAELDRSEPGWRLEELEANRKAIPDENNSARQVAKAVALLKQTDFLKRLEREDPFFDNENKLPLPARPSEKTVRWLRDLIQAAAQPLTEARKLKDMPEGRSPLVYDDDTTKFSFENHRYRTQVSYLLELDCILRAAEGDPKGALESWQAYLNAVRSVGDEPRHVTQRFRMSARIHAVALLERILAQREATDEALATLQDRLGAEEAVNLHFCSAQATRAEGHHYFQSWRDGKINLGAGEFQTKLWKKWSWGHMQYFSPARVQYVHLWATTQMVEICKLPIEQQAAAGHKFVTDVDRRFDLPVASILLFLTFMPTATDTYTHSVAHLRCAQTAVAAERYRLRRGRWPATAAALVEEGLLPAVMSDPYDGKPLRWQKHADGLAIYSVGANSVDDGGNFNRGNPRESLDVGFQLWDPAARRQAPPVP
jgi:hypothetical protein